MDYIVEIALIIVGVFIFTITILSLIGLILDQEITTLFQKTSVVIGFFLGLVCFIGIIYLVACLWGQAFDFIGGYPNIEGPQNSLIILMKLISIGYGFCMIFILLTTFSILAEKTKNFSSMKIVANISFYGTIFVCVSFGLFIVFGVWGISFNNSGDNKNEYFNNYDNTPSEWGPGVDNNNSGNSGYHDVKGYYRNDGTYVRPHIRRNPD